MYLVLYLQESESKSFYALNWKHNMKLSWELSANRQREKKRKKKKETQ